MDRSIAIGGFMGVGKSTVGRRVAARIGAPFVDLDTEIERRANQTVANVFAEVGEAEFRRLETETLASVIERGWSVVALGGGTLHQESNRELLKGRADVLVLWASYEAIAARLDERDDGSRPLWPDAPRLWLERREGYRSFGTLVDVEGLDPDAAAVAVVEALPWF